MKDAINLELYVKQAFAHRLQRPASTTSPHIIARFVPLLIRPPAWFYVYRLAGQAGGCRTAQEQRQPHRILRGAR